MFEHIDSEVGHGQDECTFTAHIHEAKCWAGDRAGYEAERAHLVAAYDWDIDRSWDGGGTCWVCGTVTRWIDYTIEAYAHPTCQQYPLGDGMGHERVIAGNVEWSADGKTWETTEKKENRDMEDNMSTITECDLCLETVELWGKETTNYTLPDGAHITLCGGCMTKTWDEIQEELDMLAELICMHCGADEMTDHPDGMSGMCMACGKRDNICHTTGESYDTCSCAICEESAAMQEEEEIDKLRWEQLMADAYKVGTHPELDMGTLMQVVEDIMEEEG